ncbi:MAG: anion permease [Firmicutes bacterium]|nr:anion permease [Bacillota bacterium]
MAKVLNAIRHDIILVVAFFAAVISCFFVRPDSAYAGYIDWRTLALLYCLMVVIAGLRRAGAFSSLARTLCKRASTTRQLGFVLVMLCFVSSMLITNDVSLLTFVPFSIMVLSIAGQQKQIIPVIVFQTVAANMGSMLTPVGNPQNLYIYSYYDIPAAEFLRMSFPVWIVSLIITLLLCMLLPKDEINHEMRGKEPLNHKSLAVYALLFGVCILTVLRVISWPLMLAAVVLVIAVYDRKMLIHADFLLLLTFICFFVFSGNMARIEAVYEVLSTAIKGHELLLGAGLSQVISNVPATLLLAGFTESARELLLGVDIGGLGTPVASLASLISIKLYMVAKDADLAGFMKWFFAANFGMLAVLVVIFGVICG